jgi:phosphate uptake regulator
MEYRKLISFGKSSYVVSLPKTWVRQNKLVKGDLIYIDERGQDLLLSKKENEQKSNEKSQIINIDNKDLLHVAREVNSSYIMDNHTITLKGNSAKDNIKSLQNIFQNLIALEIMEQTPDSIIAKDFLNIEEVAINELIRKMDIITRTMLKETSESIIDDNYENINNRDDDVNRLYFLVYRTVLYNLDNPSNALKRFKLTPINLLNLLFTGFYIEGIADEARRTARYAKDAKINTKDKKKIQGLIEEITSFYLETMKAVYNSDESLALELSNRKRDYIKKMDLVEKEKSDHHLINLIARMKRLISFIHSLGRIVYQGHHYP